MEKVIPLTPLRLTRSKLKSLADIRSEALAASVGISSPAWTRSKTGGSRAGLPRHPEKVFTLESGALCVKLRPAKGVSVAGIPLRHVDPYHTSRWCPRCGSVNPPHDRESYAIYPCRGRGLVVNSDRKASFAVAVKKLAERTRRRAVQLSAREMPVNALFRGDEGGEMPGRGATGPPDQSPRLQARVVYIGPRHNSRGARGSERVVWPWR